MSITLPAFTPAQESLFLTLGGRALDSRLPRPFLGDTMADGILTASGYDISRFPSLKTEVRAADSTAVFEIAVRAKRLDEVVQRFVLRHPDAMVLDLGAGLDSRMFRIDPPTTVEWYDIDYPVIDVLRRQLLPQPANAHSVGADLTDQDWLDEIPNDRPTVIVADGLIAFLTEEAWVSLLNRLTSHFSTGELAFNLYTTYAIRALKHTRDLSLIADGVHNPGFNDPRQPERWAPRLKLIEENFLTRAPEVAELPFFLRALTRLTAPSATLSRVAGADVIRYSFGE